jgi:hypothetical protein
VVIWWSQILHAAISFKPPRTRRCDRWDSAVIRSTAMPGPGGHVDPTAPPPPTLALTHSRARTVSSRLTLCVKASSRQTRMYIRIVSSPSITFSCLLESCEEWRLNYAFANSIMAYIPTNVPMMETIMHALLHVWHIAPEQQWTRFRTKLAWSSRLVLFPRFGAGWLWSGVLRPRKRWPINYRKCSCMLSRFRIATIETIMRSAVLF